MSEINKNINTRAEKLTELAQQAGLVLMATAATVGMLELPDHQNIKIALPNRPVFARVSESGPTINPLQREREETAPHYISYAATERTPSRSGRN